MDIFGPPTIQSLSNFGKAVVKHSLDGLEKRSKDEIDYIWNTYCNPSGSPCEWFRGNYCGHAGCGCNIGTEEKFLNKLAWASEACPIGKWGSGHITIPKESGV